MVIARVRESATKAFNTPPKFRQVTPIFLFIVTVCFVSFGALVFFLCENPRQYEAAREWLKKTHAVKRQQAKLMSKKIFNDTQNLLIIIDKDQSDRVEKILHSSLNTYYENQMNIAAPVKDSWDYLNSLNFAYSSVLTVGQGAKVPMTVFGRLFLIPYLLIGIPLMFFTLGSIVHQFVLPFLNKEEFPFTRRFAALALAATIYLVWSILVSFYLYFQVNRFSYLNSLITALFSMMTVQVTHPQVSDCVTFILLLLTTVSVAIGFLVAYLALACYGNYGIAVSTEIPEEAGGSNTQRFTVVVDQAGDSKLAVS